MSQLSAHIVYATYKALDQEQKAAFVQLIEEDRKSYGKKPKKINSIYDQLPAKYHPDNYEMIVAEFMHPKKK